MAKKASQLNFIDILSGQEILVVTRPGIGNYKIRVSDIKSLFTKSDIGLSNVNNTSDADKPVSLATQAALDNKANISHTHPIESIQGLGTALDGKAATAHTHSIAAVDGLQTALDSKAESNHAHDMSSVTGLTTALASKSDVGHSHNKTDIIGLSDDLDAINIQLTNKAALTHSHDLNQINGLVAALSNKANSLHQHNAADVDGLQTFVQTMIDNAGTIAGQVEVVELEW